jgi:L-ascorbate metabolism protein UlaG (beta-lactamase superfamily)
MRTLIFVAIRISSSMEFTYYGHSCFSVAIKGKKILFDPFITFNELAKSVAVNSIEADYILVSHGHNDHIADCITLAKRTGATVVASYEITEWLNKQGVANTHPMNTGGRRDFGAFAVKCVTAHHSSGLPDGSYGGNPMGFIVTSGEGDFYYSGDTALTLDMQLVSRWAPRLLFAVLPIGDNFTMDAADALECARMINCKTVIGVHYDTFGYIRIDHGVAKDIFNKGGVDLRLPEIGETVSMSH